MITLARSEANEAAHQLTGRDYVSFSAISTYASCPLRYYFKYVTGLPEETISSSLAFGSGIHASIEHHFNEILAGNPAPDPDALLAVFWDSWRDRQEEANIRFAKNEDIGTIADLANRVLGAFRESDLAEPGGRILGVEEELRGRVIEGVPDLLARIDLLLETPEALVVRDFKTSRSRWSHSQAEDSAEQLLLYGELARHLTPEKTLRLEFAVLTKAKSPAVDRLIVPIDNQRIERTKRIVERIWKAIETQHFYPAPSPLNCPSCPFREPCRAWTG